MGYRQQYGGNCCVVRGKRTEKLAYKNIKLVHSPLDFAEVVCAHDLPMTAAWKLLATLIVA